MRTSRRTSSFGIALALAGCATSGGKDPLKSQRSLEAQADEAPPEDLTHVGKPLVPVEDASLGVRYELPALEEGWQAPREGRGGRRGGNVQVEVGGFALAHEATAAACRDSARERFAKEKAKDGSELPALRDQAIGDWPTATWSFSRGSDEAAVRSRWAFYPRGADCLLLQVSSPRGDRFADRAFVEASRTFKAQPLGAERQREVDLLAGMGFLERRDPELALQRFEALAQREPGFAKAHFGALMAGFEIGPPAYSRALPHGVEALKAEHALSPEQRQLALRAVGVMQLAENQLRPASATLAELVVRVPDLAEGQYNYACALARLGDTGGAIDHLRAALSLDKDLVGHAKSDDDLKPLRGDARFEELLAHPPAVVAPGPRAGATPDVTTPDADEPDAD